MHRGLISVTCVCDIALIYMYRSCLIMNCLGLTSGSGVHFNFNLPLSLPFGPVMFSGVLRNTRQARITIQQESIIIRTNISNIKVKLFSPAFHVPGARETSEDVWNEKRRDPGNEVSLTPFSSIY